MEMDYPYGTRPKRTNYDILKQEGRQTGREDERRIYAQVSYTRIPSRRQEDTWVSPCSWNLPRHYTVNNKQG